MVPSLFLAHGSPMLAIEQTEYAAFLAQLAQRIRPKAIVIFTAHWETEVTTISSSDDVYDTIYDFYGFPDELYKIRYLARGSSIVAANVKERLEKNGIAVQTDTTRGLDHGSWTLLHRMYPEADIPVVQVSVNPYTAPREQYRIGEALRGLGDEDILVIGSGVTVHNLRIIKWGQTTPEPWAVEFDEWLLGRLEQDDQEALFDYAAQAPHARLAVPRAEHFVPFYIAWGSGNPQRKPSVIHRSYDLGTLSYLSLEF
ncbi:class III extradiol ring-cleavage dioxygenase [Paenibacillus validus]|uniref:DODA-type extradiol aromatic ring-opening family dioxygenase n=1 Tax=Paenibacillus TaxID=44249 RepID=UPI0006D15367|nr:MULTISPECIES: class III extradiol ring-cleavage dioxygenase [Paenibacillus]MED4602614.1 class III extradiol ring-cleavage dioxygenase [Paenibacillus validus]MED4607896.1 class III extradiol ring-cleavage dioxygenase [Paenibacillus validus]